MATAPAGTPVFFVPISRVGDGFASEKWVAVDPATQVILGSLDVARPPDRFEIPGGPCRTRDDGKVAFKNAGYLATYTAPGNPVVIKDWMTDQFFGTDFLGPISDYTSRFYMCGMYATPPGPFDPSQTPHIRVVKINGDNNLITVYTVNGSGDYATIGAMIPLTVTPAGVLIYTEGYNGPSDTITLKQWDLPGNAALADLATFTQSTDSWPNEILPLRDGSLIVYSLDNTFSGGYTLEHRSSVWGLITSYTSAFYGGLVPDLTDVAFWKLAAAGWEKTTTTTGAVTATVTVTTLQTIRDIYSGGDFRSPEAMFIAPVDISIGVSVNCAQSVDLEDPCNIKTPVYWTALQSQGGGTSTQSKVPLLDSVSYPSYPAGGIKDGRLIDVSAINRSASDWFTGAWQAQQVTAKMAITDSDDFFFTNTDWTGGSLWVYLVSEARRRANGVPRLLFRGVIYENPFTEDLTSSFTANDFISVGYNLFREDTPIPRRRITGNEFPNAPDSLVNSPTHYGTPIIFGRVSDEDDSSPMGQVKLINVGAMTLNSVTYPAVGLLCGHAVKEIEAIYQVDSTGNPVVVPGGDYGVSIWAPGFAGWNTIVPSGDLFVDIGEQRFTLIPLNGTRATDFINGKDITVNVKGCEDVGDGTGTLIDDLIIQYKYMMLQWILGVYVSGPWLPSPTFPYFPGSSVVCLVNTDSWDKAHLQSKQYLPGGFKGAFVIGAEGRRQSIRNVIQQFNVCCNVSLGFNQYSQLFVKMLDRNRSTFIGNRRTITWERDMLNQPKRSVSVKRDWLTNIVITQYNQNYRTGNFDGNRVIQDDASVSFFKQDLAVTRAYPLIRDDNTLYTVVRQQLDVMAFPVNIYTWSESLCGLRNDILDGVLVNDYAASGTTIEDKAMWIIKQTIDTKNSKVTFVAMDVDRLVGDIISFKGSFLLSGDFR